MCGPLKVMMEQVLGATVLYIIYNLGSKSSFV